MVNAQSQYNVSFAEGNKIVVINAENKISLQEVAIQYNIAQELLALYNQVPLSYQFNAGEEISIPLTETNFFRTTSVSSSNAKFSPIFYTVNKDESIQSLCMKFLVSENTMLKWNSNIQNKSNLNGSKIQVGWLKYGSLESESSNTYQAYENPAKATFKSDIKKDWNSAKNAVNSTWNKVGSSLKSKPKASNKMIQDSIKVTATPKINGTKVATEKFRVGFNSTMNSAGKGISKGASQFKNWISKKPKSTATLQNQIVNSELPKIEANAAIIQSKELIDVKSEEIDSVYNTMASEVVTEDVSNKVIQNVDQIEKVSTGALNVEGNTTWFYNGNLGSIYHVFTNAAPKGSSVVLWNKINNKSIVAKVLGPLSKSEEDENTIFILSENAMAELGAQRQIIKLTLQSIKD
jgi:LysM domain